ncbi:hypothetical protein OIU77_024826 [Salix suchowensis]|uniref:CST complex subunit CTC1 n=1 Tax=Salix suchowensis TaxID=1278906 RepID=A0ABQ9BXF1_9ROSI|nr:hypothetical protein OIU77_024826 [Salix suchowensis]
MLMESCDRAECSVWNKLNWRRKAAVIWCLRSFPESDLAAAAEGQLVKITGLVSCGSVSLESSYERAARCTYVSTLLYEYGGFGVKPMNADTSCLQWNLKYCERFSTDFYITDRRSGIRAMVKAGSGCKVVPLIVESKLVTTRQCRTLSSHLRKWLLERNLSLRAGNFCLFRQPQELFSTGCLWQKLLLPADVDGLILGFSGNAGPNMNPAIQIRGICSKVDGRHSSLASSMNPSSCQLSWLDQCEEHASNPQLLRMPPVPA